MEKRFVTQSFPFRLFTTILGMTFVNAYTGFQYFVSETQSTTFLEFINSMCYDAMHNDEDDQEAVPVGGDRGAGTSSPFRTREEEASFHILGRIQYIEGYTGGPKQRCSVCTVQRLSVRCCRSCSNPDKQFVVCDPKVRNGLSVHKADPCCKAHKFRRPSGQKNGHGPTKRAREAAAETRRQRRGPRSGASPSWDTPGFRPRAARGERGRSDEADASEASDCGEPGSEPSELGDEDEDMFGFD